MAAAHPIVVRRPVFELDEQVPHYWFDGDPFATHYLNALSSVFPDGEAFFVRSVQQYRDRIEDPELRKAIQGFSAQEGQHSRQHDRHLKLLQQQGYSAIESTNDVMRKVLEWNLRRFPRLSLASTAALEHLTAILARRLLSDRERWIEPMDPRMAQLWEWHALEEAEHKAVAFDVLMQVAPGLGLRRWSLTLNTFGVFIEMLVRTGYMLWKDGVFFRRSTWASGWRFLFGERGFLRGLGPDFRSWYRRDFHPDQQDDGPLIEAGRARLAMQLAS
ncbi:MAG: metal-dependent hydrolase [Deltaproteobacteria bacterium]|nr:metal-dependent hydrolase [Deltaproteobacteria bacterium]MBW2396442.1 metal-dependent hydrolase [Deltaproteobacteria bacterium]